MTQEMEGPAHAGGQAVLERDSAASGKRRELVEIVTDREGLDGDRRLEAEVARLVEAERLGIGMELHDNLCQQLVAAAMRLASVVPKLRTEQSAFADVVAEVLDTVRHAAEGAHRLARGLVPVDIEAEGLAQALEELARQTHESHAVACEFHYPEPIVVESNPVATHLYRIAQEAVQNALKHAKPTRIVISLMPAEGNTLCIEDNGTGIRSQNPRSQGVGLRLIAYRARIIGAALSIVPAPEGGTIVRCTRAA